MLLPDESGTSFMAEVAAFALVLLWRAGRQASQEELGNRPKSPHGTIHLVFTRVALVIVLSC